MTIKETKYNGYYVDDQGNVYSTWHACCKGRKKVTMYAMKIQTDDVGRKQVRIQNKTIRVHRLVYDTFYGIPNGSEIDHKDRIAGNNALSNLRLSTHTTNQHNKNIRKDNTTGYKGVHYNKGRNTFQAYIMTPERHHKYLGSYSTAEQAAKAYDEAAVRYFKDFAATNKDIR